MNRKILIAEALLALIIILAFKISSKPRTLELINTPRQQVYAGKMMMQCSPDWTLLNPDSLAVNMGVLPGWGNYHWNINSRSDSAKYYFNQGINMYYAFHIIESMASFKKAQTFDENNAMLHWAEALAFGPNINDIEYAATPGALSATQKALTLSSASSAIEKALIMAMQVRYSPDSTVSRTSLNESYAKAMKKVYNQFPHDADVAALYADALMLLHPWMYWKHDGKPETWTPEIVSVIENNLKEHPMHPGANHYYIHVVEASPTPGLATKSADRLSVMMPAVSHMVHMPSHIYIRTGEYQKGIDVNEKSIDGYNKYLQLFPDVVNNVSLYLIHNLHMKTACAMMEPNYAFSKKTAAECIVSFDTSFLSLPQPLGNFIQYVYMIPQMVDVRYGKWDALISQPIIDKHYAYAHVLSIWTKGLAEANTNKLVDAKRTLVQLQGAMKNPDLKIVLNPFNAAISAALVAEKILQGTIAEKEGNIKAAVASYEAAVKLEDKLIYTEPRDWLIPSRHYLANALIQQKKSKIAKQILTEDLQQNPHNFYALSAMQKINKSAMWKTQLNSAWKNADMKEAKLVY